jgi:hypothetical protein
MLDDPLEGGRIDKALADVVLGEERDAGHAAQPLLAESDAERAANGGEPPVHRRWLHSGREAVAREPLDPRGGKVPGPIRPEDGPELRELGAHHPERSVPVHRTGYPW